MSSPTMSQQETANAPTIHWISADGSAAVVPDADLPALLQRDDGWLWLDLPAPTEKASRTLKEVFGFHPRAVDACLERNHVPRVHGYTHWGDEHSGSSDHDDHISDGMVALGQSEQTRGERAGGPGAGGPVPSEGGPVPAEGGPAVHSNHVFLVLHRPLQGEHGHVHYLELDQFIGPNFLVTVHGPASPKVALRELLTETTEVAGRLTAGRLRPQSPLALSCSIVSGLTVRNYQFVGEQARVVGELEQRVMAHEADDNPQDFLDEIQAARHALLTVQTMASQSAEVYARAINVLTYMGKDDLKLLGDVRDQYHRLDKITASQLEFLHGVTDYYRARTDTKMTIAAERLAVIAAITLPVTAISSVLGMNVIVNDHTDFGWLAVLFTLMAALSGWLLVWAKRQGWF